MYNLTNVVHRIGVIINNYLTFEQNCVKINYLKFTRNYSQKGPKMKKTLSVILTICMILLICSFYVSAAPQGTAITSEAEFLAMKEDGAYYLANDLSLTQSYDKLFTGVFDGNGKTVTVNGEPMFLEFCGTGMNLTINGTVVADHAKDNGYWARGAFACMASGDEVVTIYNITNNANVTGFLEEDTATYAGLLGHAYTGGIIGAFDNQSVGTAASFQIINCTNNGNVKGYHCTGGITGILYLNDSAYSGEQFVKVVNATNNGNIEGVNTYTGGIVGRVYYCVDAEFTGCINNGEVAGLGNTGGIIGHTTNTSTIMRVCQNNGHVYNLTVEGETAYAGGLIAYAQGTKCADFSASVGKYASIVEYCINTGVVEGHCRVGGIVGSAGASGAYGITHIRYCINTGAVTNWGHGGKASQDCIGGIQGYGYGSKADQYTYITNCINTGSVTAQSAEFGIVSHFLGYISSDYAIIADNMSTGTISSAAGKEYAIGWNNAGVYDVATGNNKIPATNTHKLAYENGNEEGTFNTGVVDESYLLLGTAIADFNAAYKAATGATSDAMTMTVDGTFNPKIVVMEAAAPEITYPEVNTEPETTAAPETTKAPETEAPVETTEAPAAETEAPAQTDAPAPEQTEAPKEGGCGSMISAGAILAILCLAAVPMVKKNRD